MTTEAVLGHDLIKVHKQSPNENLYQSITYEIRKGGRYGISALAGVQSGHPAEEYALYVHEGTDKMKPRPFLRQQLEEMRDDLKSKIHREFSTEFWKAVDKNMSRGK